MNTQDLKKEFLALKTYEEFDANREKYKALYYDEEISEHLNKLFGSLWAPDDMHHDADMSHK